MALRALPHTAETRAIPATAGHVALALTLTLTTLLTGCADRPVVADALPDYLAPTIERPGAGTEGVITIDNRMARERLRIHTLPPAAPVPDGARLLFMEGRAALPLDPAGRRVAWADMDGARVMIFGPRGELEATLQGSPEAGVLLTDPVAATPWQEEGIAVHQRDGSIVLFRGTQPPALLPSPLPAPVTGSHDGIWTASRSVLYFALSGLAPEAPLLWARTDEETIPLGRARAAPDPLLAPLVNAGWALPHPEGEVYFAPALRPELHRFELTGEESWRSTWPMESGEPDEPGFHAASGVLTPRFRIVHHAVAIGPDRKIYLLSAPDRSERPTLLLVFDRAGTLVREGRVPDGHAIYVDRRGAVFTATRDDALARAPRPIGGEPVLAPFDLPSLVGTGERVRLEDHAGKVVVVNVWSSWCPPCRREIPLLDRMQGEYDPDEVVVIGLNEDLRPEQGRQFLAELGGVSFPQAEGGGRLRRELGYRGLPYTLVLDRDHRVRRTFFGFGDSVDPIRLAVDRVLGPENGEALGASR